jgi:hypothetical protein
MTMAKHEMEGATQTPFTIYGILRQSKLMFAYGVYTCVQLT